MAYVLMGTGEQHNHPLQSLPSLPAFGVDKFSHSSLHSHLFGDQLLG